MSDVKRQVHGVIQDIEGASSVKESIVTQMRAIPAEVQQIADQAFLLAVQESNEQAKLQFDFALDQLPEESIALRNAKWQIVGKVPSMQTEAPIAAKLVAGNTVEQ